MNLLEHIVTEVLSLPYNIYGMWWVDVNGESYGVVSKHSLMFETKEEAFIIKIGSKYNA